MLKAQNHVDGQMTDGQIADRSTAGRMCEHRHRDGSDTQQL